MVLKGGVSTSTSKLGSSIGYGIRSALFHEAIRNLNWSRGYSWFVELDDVPNPFQRGGVIGLPVVNITYELKNSKSFEWNSAVEDLAVPLSSGICNVSLDILDDEQCTILTFLERWYNNIYNSYMGVLPITEAAKCLSIYKLKSTRSRVDRRVYTYNPNDIGGNLEYNQDGSASILSENNSLTRELLVYPTSQLQEVLDNKNEPHSYTVQFNVVEQLNADYGNPALHQGATGFFSKFNKDSDSSLLGKMADYI